MASLRTIPDYDELDRAFKNDPNSGLDKNLTSDPVLLSHSQSEVMDFKESHFKESSESGGEERPLEVDSLAEGLESMPDVEDVMDHEQQESESNRATLFGQAQAMIASDVMSNLMASTMTRLSRLSETMATVRTGTATSETQSGAHSVHYSFESGETDVDVDKKNVGRLTESVDSDALLAEFEFLEKDLDAMDEETEIKKDTE